MSGVRRLSDRTSRLGEAMPIQVVTPGDFRVAEASLARLRHAAPDIRSVTEAASATAMYALAAGTGDPVVALVGGDRPASALGGIARKLAAANPRGGLVVVAPAPAASDVIGDALLQGARGWVFTESPAEELITSVRAVAAGHLFLPPAILRELADIVLMLTCQQQATAAGSELTGRELDVLRLLALGTTNSEIAARLFISEATVHSHVLNILRKMNARNRTEAVAMLYRGGLKQTVRPAAAV